MRISRRWFSALVWVGLLAWGLGCSGGGGESGAADGATGSVALTLTDAPTDEFIQVLVTVTRIDLLPGDTDSDRKTIFEGRETFDLLALENVAEPFAIADDVPVGTYSKLRMTVEEIELVRMLEGGATESIFPRLPGGDRIDLNPRGGFEVEPGETLAVQLDLDARRSIHIVGGGNGSDRYQFRSQVFVEILRADRVSRLVSIEGVVADTDDAADPFRFRLCEVAIEHRSRQGRRAEACVTVFADSDTSVFDDSGLSVGRDEISRGERASVLGRFARDADSRFAVNALVVELGGSAAFLMLTGVADGGYDPATGSVRVDLDPGQGFSAGTSIDVDLAEGARIFARTGEELGTDDILDGSRVEVDGVLVLGTGEPDRLRAAVLFVRTPEEI